ncbi:HNH endonuclease [Mesorhizobium sp. M1148]|uniref:HNH endonuclease n=1 Tax=unclassified Mesorhizobium TaxID=325217 RepID=UPI0033360DD8
MAETDDFDAPIFKKLTKTDTGTGKSKQAGFLVPKSLGKYFPTLPPATVANLAPNVDISAELYIENKLVGVASTTYQYQTRGLKRTPERRVTGDLTKLMSYAKADDYLLIERNLKNRLLFRLTLLPQGTPSFDGLTAKVGSITGGALDPLSPPISEVDLAKAEAAQDATEHGTFALFDASASTTETRVQRVARSKIFQKRVISLYSSRCAVCSEAFATPDGRSEVEAAHIVPRGKKGVDDARNGMALCRSHHWAFDQGLFGLDAGGNIFMEKKSSDTLLNKRLLPFIGKKLISPSDLALSPHPDALAWHFENVVGLHK